MAWIDDVIAVAARVGERPSRHLGRSLFLMAGTLFIAVMLSPLSALLALWLMLLIIYGED